MTKKDMLDKLYQDYAQEFSGEELVFGEGSTQSGLLLIGEAPGRDEVRLGRPFVGMAGKNLDEFLGILGMDRESIYITNAIKYRLSKVNPGSGRIVNRPARGEEVIRSRKYLLLEIGILCPQYIVTLGNVPLRAVMGHNSINIGDVHGKLVETDMDGTKRQLYPLYHPASIIYNNELKETYIEDINNLKNIIAGLVKYNSEAVKQ